MSRSILTFLFLRKTAGALAIGSAMLLGYCCFALAGEKLASGIPASPYPIFVRQPSGQEIALRMRGTGISHWLEDNDGFPVMEHGGQFVYASSSAGGNFVPTPLLVGKDDPRRAGLAKKVSQPRRQRKSLAPSSEATPPTTLQASAVTGTLKNIVILMRFADHTNRVLPSIEDISKVFNAPGGDPELAPSGSVRDFYHENSYGAMTLDSAVFAWVTLPHTEAYYAEGLSGMGTAFTEAITDALTLADPMIDFTQFDPDHASRVDAITFIHSGYGAEWGGTDPDGAKTENRIWSHRAPIPEWTSAEGVKVSDYSVSPAFWGISGSKPTHIGVICHETGHHFGLPDLYDWDGSSAGVGSWCVMSDPWGISSDQLYPPHFSAWCKVFLGWINPTVLESPGTFMAPQVETNPTVYKVQAGFPSGEYLLVENRQAYGFDQNLEQGGLAIWHIDENKYANSEEGYPGQSGWPTNGNHYEVALLQADGLYDLEEKRNTGDPGDLYSANGVSELGPGTSPSSDAYALGNVYTTGNRLFNIGASGPNMTFSFSRRQELRVTAVTQTGHNCTVSVRGTPGSQAILQASTDLLTWVNVATNTIAETGLSLFAENLPSNAESRFYRAQSL